MANIKKTENMLEFWASGIITCNNDWGVCTANLPVQHQDGKVLPMQFENEVKPVACKQILAISKQMSSKIANSPVCWRIRLFANGKANIGVFAIISEISESSSEKTKANIAKVGFDLQKIQAWSGFPKDKVQLSSLASKIFEAYGIDVEDFIGTELPLESPADVKARKQAKRKNGLMKSMSEFFAK